MERRELLKLIAVSTGAAFVCADALAWDKPPQATALAKTGFSSDDLLLMNDVAETILPKTNTPGAKDAQVGQMMAIFVADCYTADQQQLFKQGLLELNKLTTQQYAKPFLLLDSAQKHACLSELDQQAKTQNSEAGLWGMESKKPNSRSPRDKSPLPHYFTLMKQLTLYSFFTSEVGATKVLRYVAIPGKYDGDLPYKKGDRAWATG
ncbi:gluconate 2-dehydrogenase subunit 3 family protein [Neptunicella marina]|uniref:Gluconate 2-dehydrogenase subunit 3 family protein n=1 Tax=Neptunicella marina TaxID=2125989 RepID=A0A8J6M1J0_9ALTE|nr:gluconate 2-dehydrogenase subunit 3 family protein [Neptunicella marina]MBC3765533.1 gluconate 2-dehydrogenase subunit 3 family protein [Neptunicella marina]